MNSSHPFDRYDSFTDLKALKAATLRPLRKSVRVNTLKSAVADFRRYAKEHNWQLEPVPWCSEGFFIDRSDALRRAQGDIAALGKDLLHLLGHFYMQEAASMLPVELLDPQPGDAVLDMSAAPGSKTSQIAAKLQGRGLVVANEPQSKRLLTLKTALHRLGVTNVILAKKTGQWFGPHMTERFDRVLIDAPCTAQGTARKDPDALKYSSEAGITKAAKLQLELLEAAVHACKVGGRVVYSTCTLTPEENEMVVEKILNKFCDQLEAIEPQVTGSKLQVASALQDSKQVQEYLQLAPCDLPLVRLWPQTYDTEGFFCAVLQKTAPTGDKKRMEWQSFREQPLKQTERQRVEQYFESIYGTSFLEPTDRLFRLDGQLYVSTDDVLRFDLPLTDFALGLPFAKELKDHTYRLTNELATLRGHLATANVCELSDDQVAELLQGKDSSASPALSGDVVLRWRGMSIGLGLAQTGVLKNRLSRWVIGHGQN